MQRYLKESGIEVELKIEYGAYMATTFAGKFEGMAGPCLYHLGTA